MQAITRFLRVLDWLGVVFCFGYGLWTGSYWWFIGGVASAGLAWVNLGERVRRGVTSSVQRKYSTRRASASAIPVSDALPPAELLAPVCPFAYPFAIRVARLDPSPRNQLTPAAVNAFPLLFQRLG